mmetsp:Transcript_25729/g.40704  ORF Transcript_25729/g.40704 Transcript_25729/m.40704 type:complete len:228 (-) Transcript_25729:237-920(-)
MMESVRASTSSSSGLSRTNSRGSLKSLKSLRKFLYFCRNSILRGSERAAVASTEMPLAEDPTVVLIFDLALFDGASIFPNLNLYIDPLSSNTQSSRARRARNPKLFLPPKSPSDTPAAAVVSLGTVGVPIVDPTDPLVVTPAGPSPLFHFSAVSMAGGIGEQSTNPTILWWEGRSYVTNCAKSFSSSWITATCGVSSSRCGATRLRRCALQTIRSCSPPTSLKSESW